MKTVTLGLAKEDNLAVARIKEIDSRDEGQFERVEEKYLLAKEEAIRIIRFVSSEAVNDFPDEKTNFCLIRSTYFDSTEFDFFKNHFYGLDTRFKLRLREYGPDGSWDTSTCFLELKIKKLGVTKKTRIAVDKEEILKMISAGHIKETTSLKQLNLLLRPGKLTKRISKLNKILNKYAIEPSEKVEYSRLAFKNKHARITFDSNLKAEGLIRNTDREFEKIIKEPLWMEATQMKERYIGNQTCIMEIKYKGEPDSWIDGLRSNYALEKTKFSKYCWSVNSHLKNSEH